jgi:hypothetical protein
MLYTEDQLSKYQPHRGNPNDEQPATHGYVEDRHSPAWIAQQLPDQHRIYRNVAQFYAFLPMEIFAVYVNI